MTERVSRLVIERLHSLLATYDGVLDGLQNKLEHGVLEPVREVASRVAELSNGQEALSLQTRDLATASHSTANFLSTMPEMLADLISTGPTSGRGPPSPGDFLRIGSTVDSLSSGQQALQGKASELLALQQDVLSRLIDLQYHLAASVKAAQLAHNVSKEEFEEVRSMMVTNTDLQVQLAKARTEYSDPRSDKDAELERIGSTESKLDQLRAKVDEIQAAMLLRATDATTSQARMTEVEEELFQPLAQLQTSDLTIKSQQERLLELEELNAELNADKQALLSKVRSLEAQVDFASRDKDAVLEELSALRKAKDALVLQKSHWKDLRHAKEQSDKLAVLLSQAELEYSLVQKQLAEKNTEEHRAQGRERVLRDRVAALEACVAQLQADAAHQERHVATGSRPASTARPSVAEVQRRAAGWDWRTNDDERPAPAERDQTEDGAARFKAEHSLVQTQPANLRAVLNLVLR
ncbi:hypothetical protein EI94DRAFT_322631 [Lactarius quietus]|nr:hypothetical protein EI94DRAFT_322631 [Lactarius quietus]